MVARTKGAPIVDLPNSSTRTRGLEAARRRKYSTVCDQLASLRSSPGVKPRTSDGAGTPDAFGSAEDVCAAFARVVVRVVVRVALSARRACAVSTAFACGMSAARRSAKESMRLCISVDLGFFSLKTIEALDGLVEEFSTTARVSLRMKDEGGRMK